MTREQFQHLLATDRKQAIKTLFTSWVSEWMNDGEEEIVRVLSLWADRSDSSSGPVLDLGNADDIMELADLRDMFDEKEDNVTGK